MPTTTLQNTNHHIQVNSLGSQILEWTYKNKPIFYASSLLKRSGMPLMFPFCGPLKDGIFLSSGKPLAQHGFGRLVEWTQICGTANFINFQLDSSNLDTQTQEAYPYSFVADFFVKLGGENNQNSDNKVIFSLNIENTSLVDLPIAPGFHPYFYVRQETKPNLKITNLNGINSNLLPWSTGVEAQFYINPKELIINNISGYRVKMTDQSAMTIGDKTTSLPCDLMTVWAGEVADFVCIEPMSKKFDSINTNPILIPAGAFYALEYTFEIIE